MGSAHFAAATGAVCRDGWLGVIEVWHMLRPHSADQDPELVRLIEEEMAMT
jgi:hypothetical protein